MPRLTHSVVFGCVPPRRRPTEFHARYPWKIMIQSIVDCCPFLFVSHIPSSFTSRHGFTFLFASQGKEIQVFVTQPRIRIDWWIDFFQNPINSPLFRPFSKFRQNANLVSRIHLMWTQNCLQRWDLCSSSLNWARTKDVDTGELPQVSTSKLSKINPLPCFFMQSLM